MSLGETFLCTVKNRVEDGKRDVTASYCVFRASRSRLQTTLGDGPLEKLWRGLWGGGGWGIFESQVFFSLPNSFFKFFFGRSMKIY